MTTEEKVAKWLEEKHSFEPEDATEVAKDFLDLLDQQGEPVAWVSSYQLEQVASDPRIFGVVTTLYKHKPEVTTIHVPLYLHPPASREREALARKLALDVRRVGTNVGRCCRKLEPYDFELAVKTSRFWEQVEAQTDAILSESREREALKALVSHWKALSGKRGHSLGCECGASPDGIHCCRTLEEGFKQASAILGGEE